MRITMLVLGLVLAVGLVGGCGGEADKGDSTKPANIPTPADEVTQPKVPDVAGQAGLAIIEASCTECHDAAKVTDAAKSRDDWEAQIEMCSGGSPLEEDKAKLLLDYLAEKHGG